VSSISGLSTASSLLSGLQNPAPLTVGGLATGLDTNKIIDALLAIEQQKIGLLQANQDRITQEQTAYKDIEAKLLALQATITDLGRSQNGVFDSRTVTSSNQDLLTAAASSSASPGVYTLQVNSLAQAQETASQGYESANSSITQGTFQLRVGSGATATITIDGTNNTLQGLANAINSSGAGVTASIINIGTGAGTEPYRLLLTANKSGASNAIAITNNLAADSGGAVKPVFDSNYVGTAGLGPGYTGTATPTGNTGAGGYTGTTNNTYTFTVINGGTVGTDNNIQIAYTDSTGANAGTITLNSGDAGVFKNVAQGIQVQLSAGTLVAGQTFSLNAFVPTVQKATNASVTVGSGSGALTIQSPTNQVDGVITGVTLNLQGADSTKSVTLTVAADTDKAKKAIEDFVSAYNDLAKSIDAAIQFDPKSGVAGPLLGDESVLGIQDQIQSALDSIVKGVNPLASSLKSIGISFTDDGHLSVDDAKLSDALAGNVSGVSLNDIRNLFALAGTSTNPGIQFVLGSTKTQASTTPYQVQVTQAAQQASITATNPLAASTVIDNTNNALTITVDGTTSSTIALAPGTYTPQSLAQELQAEINANSSLSGRQVAVGLSGNQLTITSSTYGSSSQVTIGTGTALTPLGFAGTETNKGVDVVGSFVVDGIVEPALGTGQFLTGNSTNANTAGLEVRVTLSPSQITAGPEGSITVTRGIASKLDVALNGLLDPVTGRLKSIEDGLQSNIDDIQSQIAEETDIMNSKRDSLLQQFVALESTVSQLQTVGNFLTQQFASLLAPSNGFFSSSSSGNKA
jgi:flagellar hook-associated protein 2